MEINSLMKKIKGYQKAPRDRFLLLKDRILTQEEFLLYELGLAITDWDKTHTDIYGTFKATNQELAEILGWSTDSSVSRYRKNLIEKGYFIPVDNNRLQAKDFHLRELKKSSAKMQEVSAKNETSFANTQEEVAEMQKDHALDRNYPLVSYKSNLGLSNELTEDISDEELDEIARALDNIGGTT